MQMESAEGSATADENITTEEVMIDLKEISDDTYNSNVESLEEDPLALSPNPPELMTFAVVKKEMFAEDDEISIKAEYNVDVQYETKHEHLAFQISADSCVTDVESQEEDPLALTPPTSEFESPTLFVENEMRTELLAEVANRNISSEEVLVVKQEIKSEDLSMEESVTDEEGTTDDITIAEEHMLDIKEEVKIEETATNWNDQDFLTARACVLNDSKVDRSIYEGAVPVSCHVESDLEGSNLTSPNCKKPFKCDVCYKTFSFKSALKTHSRVHSGEKPFNCDVCYKTFSCISNLKSHSCVHNSKKEYKCDVCYKTFSFKSSLNNHSRSHSGEKLFKCNVCQNSYTNQSNLTYHSRIHSGEKPFKCDVCYKTFSYSSNLKSHSRVHYNKKEFKCDICYKTFLHKSNLQSHIRTHSGEKPFKCDICCKSFTHYKTLINHNNIHTGEKPFKCNVCCKTFSFKSNLYEHNRIHSGEKPFKCNVCQKSFTHKKTLNEHTRIHSEKMLSQL